MQNKGSSTSAIERRQHPRFQCQGKAAIRTPESPTVLWGLITDLSATGCYVELASPLSAGREAQLKLTVGDTSVTVDGRVAVVHPMFGMGVAFTSCPPAERQKLQKILSNLGSSTGDESSPRVESTPTAPRLGPVSPTLHPLPRPTNSMAVAKPANSAAARGTDNADAPSFRLTPQVACSVLDQVVKLITQKGVLTRTDLLGILQDVQAGQKK